MTTLILILVFIYFAIGGTMAAITFWFDWAFTGKLSIHGFALFFFWPLMYLIQIPYVFWICGSLVAASTMTGLAYWIITLL